MRMSGWRTCCAALVMALGGAQTYAALAQAQTQQTEAGLKLHVPSPDWRDQIIYFVMIDRFADGRADNNDQGAGEYDPADPARYSGGDLPGLTRHLGYIQGLGATAVWITPPIANRWWDPQAKYGGYHGYWAENFKAVDAHYGTLQDYKHLSDQLHRRGMYLVQDVVVNHTGNFFSYGAGWKESDLSHNFRRIADSNGKRAPTQSPFDQNDVNNPTHRKADIYHWTPAITDYNDQRQEWNFQLADLDDLNTDNPVVRDALRDSYGYWIREVGVDGFRVDTAFYVPPEYFRDFMYSDHAAYPGMERVAKRTGRERFHVFGEGFGIDKPFDDAQMRKIDGYMRDAGGQALLPGMIQFPLYGTLGDVFVRGHPTAELADRIQRTLRLHSQPHLMPSFIDNHDVDRFLSGGSQAALKQALLLIMTLPGIPTLYYGTEQGFTEQRASMFAKGYGAGGHDHFDVQAPLYRYIRQATTLRRNSLLFSRGTPTVLKDSPAGPGVLAYRVNHEDASAIVVFNTSDREVLLDSLKTGATEGALLKGLFGIDTGIPDVVVGTGGRISRVLPARSGWVWKVTREKRDRQRASAVAPALALERGQFEGDFIVRGTASPSAPLLLVVDGDLDSAKAVAADAEGRWQATVDTSNMADSAVAHRVVAWDPDAEIASESREFRVARRWNVLADVADPSSDDHGPTGRYQYPNDAGWREHRPLDIHGVRVSGTGGAMKIELQMNRLTALWNPANGFDHVAFTIFIEIPGAPGGTSVMPLQNATLPAGMRWHYRLRAHGWSNLLFSSAGAGADNEGTPASPSATLAADAGSNTLTLTFPANALGNLQTLSGVKLYITTWDYDAKYRALAPAAQGFSFGGGDGAVDPLVMDDTAVIVLP